MYTKEELIERERLIMEMERDAKIMANIIDKFDPEVPLDFVDIKGVVGELKVAIVRDIPLIEGNPKATQVLVNKICRETGYVPHDIREVNGERCIMLVKDLGGKLGKSIAIGKDLLLIGVAVFDDRNANRRN